jgi:WD40 repeat protein
MLVTRRAWNYRPKDHAASSRSTSVKPPALPEVVDRLITARDTEMAALSPDGKRIVTGSGYVTVRVWDVQTGQPLSAPLHAGVPTVWDLAPASARYPGWLLQIADWRLISKGCWSRLLWTVLKFSNRFGRGREWNQMTMSGRFGAAGFSPTPPHGPSPPFPRLLRQI